MPTTPAEGSIARVDSIDMAAVVGYLVAGTVSIVAALWVAGPRYAVRRDPTFELSDVSARLVGVMSALAGFAVTALVFLVTQARNLPDPTSTSFTTVLAMIVVAYMGYFSSSLLFANVSHRVDDSIFDLAAAQYAGASISLFSVFVGWFALKPLFETFGLIRVADLVGWLLVGALVVGYGLLASALFRSGYASARLTALLPVLALVATVAYAIGIGLFAPGLRSPEATLNLTVVAFVVGVPAYTTMTILPILARRERLAAILADRWHLAVIAYAQGAMVLIGFLLLGVLGLA
jgi:uncharacterized membrane protein